MNGKGLSGLSRKPESLLKILFCLAQQKVSSRVKGEKPLRTSSTPGKDLGHWRLTVTLPLD